MGPPMWASIRSVMNLEIKLIRIRCILFQSSVPSVREKLRVNAQHSAQTHWHKLCRLEATEPREESVSFLNLILVKVYFLESDAIFQRIFSEPVDERNRRERHWNVLVITGLDPVPYEEFSIITVRCCIATLELMALTWLTNESPSLPLNWLCSICHWPDRGKIKSLKKIKHIFDHNKENQDSFGTN